MPDLPLETELLRAALARRYTDTPLPTDLSPRLQQVNWDHFLWLGQQHRTLAAWPRLLTSAELACVPPEIQAQLQAVAEVNQLQILARARECCRLQDLFSQQGIDALALSGWALGQRHHAQPLHREIEPATGYCVREADLGRAQALLRSAGYADPDPLRLRERHRSDVSLLPPLLDGGARGENETTLVWPMSETWILQGRAFRLLHPHDWLLRLCARGHDHLWQRLHRLVDVAELLRACTEAEWPALWARAQRFGLERALLVGAGITCRVLDRTLPAFLAARLTEFPEAAAAIAAQADRVRAGAVDLLPGAAALGLRAAMGFPARPAATPPSSAILGRFVSTSEPLVRRMLELAEVGPADVVYDLGCGDGRVVLAAAKRGARAVGIDLDPQRIAEAEARAAQENLAAGRVRFVCADLRTVSLAEATVVCLYLQDFAYDLLWPKFERELRPGTRIVSHHFTFAGRVPEKSARVRTSFDSVPGVHLWRIAAPRAVQQ